MMNAEQQNKTGEGNAPRVGQIMTVRGITAQRDELLAACRRTIAEWPGDQGAFPYLEAAIASVEGKQ